MFFIRQNFLIGIIFLIGLFLRMYALSGVPVGFHGDEASIGYNAYSLLKTAKDQDGNFLPLSFDQFGNFRAAGYQYIAVPFIFLFDLNAFSVRLPGALFGSLTIVIFYLFLKELFKKKAVGLIGAFLLAILPWHINISRATSEAVIASFFVVLGAYILQKGLRLKTFSFKFFLLSFLSFSLSFFFYHASGPFVILFLPLFFLFNFLEHRPKKKKVIGSVFLYFTLTLSLIFFLTAGRGGGRVSQVSLLNIPGGTRELKHSMDQDGTQNPLLTRFYHNKLYFYGRHFMTFYSQHLSGDFLFVNNGNPIRYKMPWIGNLYWITVPFLVLGFAFLLSEGIRAKKYVSLIPIAWLFIGVIPAALTWEDIPNVIRSSLMVPALVMIIAFGFYEIMKILKSRIRKIIIIIIVFILFQNTLVFLHNYFYHAKTHEPWYRSAAEKELVFSIAELSNTYKEFVMTTERNNNLIFHLFYLKFDPATFQKLGSPREKDHLRFQNMVFRYGACPIGDADLANFRRYRSTLFVVKTDECYLPPRAEIIRTINTPDGSPAFHLVRLRQ